jgi:hypothetical protein
MKTGKTEGETTDFTDDTDRKLGPFGFVFTGGCRRKGICIGVVLHVLPSLL